MKRLILICCLLVGATLCTRASEEKTALQIIKAEGELTITDGSSSYTFKKDGSFHSRPFRQMDGRLIDGTWRAPGGDAGRTVEFIINGKISWVEGPQPQNEFRTITMWIYPGLYKEKGSLSDNTSHLYKCYFLIDEMKKT